MFTENIKTGWNLGVYGGKFAINHPKLLILPMLSAAALFGVFYAALYAFNTAKSLGPLLTSLIFAAFTL